MTTEQLIRHLRKVHGIEDGTIYDPWEHAYVPAICFGVLPPDVGGTLGQHLRPVHDLSAEALRLGIEQENARTEPVANHIEVHVTEQAQ